MTQATTHGMVCAAQPEAAEAGADVLRTGGNVVDAAIAAALVQTVVDPQMCGIAGMGNMQIYMPGQGIHTSIDFHGRCLGGIALHPLRTARITHTIASITSQVAFRARRRLRGSRGLLILLLAKKRENSHFIPGKCVRTYATLS